MQFFLLMEDNANNMLAIYRNGLHGVGVEGTTATELDDIITAYESSEMKFSPVKTMDEIGITCAMHFFPPMFLLFSKQLENSYFMGVGTKRDSLIFLMEDIIEEAHVTVRSPSQTSEAFVKGFCGAIALLSELIKYVVINGEMSSSQQRTGFMFYSHFLQQYLQLDLDEAKQRAAQLYKVQLKA